LRLRNIRNQRTHNMATISKSMTELKEEKQTKQRNAMLKRGKTNVGDDGEEIEEIEEDDEDPLFTKREISSCNRGQPNLKLERHAINMLLQHSKITTIDHPEFVISDDEGIDQMHLFYGKDMIAVPLPPSEEDDEDKIELLPSLSTSSDKPKYGCKATQNLGLEWDSKCICAHNMLLNLGYAINELSSTGKYFPIKNRKTDLIGNMFISSENPAEPDLQMHWKSSPVSFLLMHAKAKRIESNYNFVAVEGKPNLSLKHGTILKSVEISKFPDGNLRMEEAYLDVAEEVMKELGYGDDGWLPFKHPFEDYVCTVKSDNSGEPPLAFYNYQSLTDLLEANMRLKSRTMGKKAPKFVKVLKPSNDMERWTRLLYAGLKFEVKLRNKDIKYKENNYVQSRQWCASQALQHFGYNLRVVPKMYHVYMFRMKKPPTQKQQKQEKENEHKEMTFKSEDPLHPELTCFSQAFKHNYIAHLELHYTKAQESDELKKLCTRPVEHVVVQHVHGCAVNLSYADKIFQEFCSQSPDPSPGELQFARTRAARSALLSFGYKFPSWQEGDVWNMYSHQLDMAGELIARAGLPVKRLKPDGTPMRGGPVGLNALSRGGPRGGAARGGRGGPRDPFGEPMELFDGPGGGFDDPERPRRGGFDFDRLMGPRGGFDGFRGGRGGPRGGFNGPMGPRGAFDGFRGGRGGPRGGFDGPMGPRGESPLGPRGPRGGFDGPRGPRGDFDGFRGGRGGPRGGPRGGFDGPMRPRGPRPDDFLEDDFHGLFEFGGPRGPRGGFGGPRGPRGGFGGPRGGFRGGFDGGRGMPFGPRGPPRGPPRPITAAAQTSLTLKASRPKRAKTEDAGDKAK